MIAARIAFIVAAFAAVAGSTSAQTNREFCKSNGASVNSAARVTDDFVKAMVDLPNLEATLGSLGQEVKAAASDVDKAKPAAVRALRTYVEGLQDLAYQLQRCGR